MFDIEGSTLHEFAENMWIQSHECMGLYPNNVCSGFFKQVFNGKLIWKVLDLFQYYREVQKCRDLVNQQSVFRAQQANLLDQRINS